LDRLRHKLRDGTKKIGIIIDNLEPALENGRFIEEHRRYVELLRVLTEPDVQSVTLITSREPLHENSSVWLYPLSELSEEAWNQFFESCNINTGSSPLSNTSALEQIHQAYGGNAEAMFVLGGAIQNECQGDLEAYWQENREDLLINPTLENLVKTQFDKLQQDNEQAYRLLCRLGCFRYQDVPSVPKEGIFYLLWDVQEERRNRVLKALRDRSLVKVCNDEYYLHPVIRAEAINRLRESEDWETANRKAADFWTDSVKTIEIIEDALRALAAYYHYVEIQDFELAGRVIIKQRENKWEKDEALGRAFYRFGLFQQIIDLITRIIDNINSSYSLIRLYNILGSLYWFVGSIHKALEYHNKSASIAESITEKYKLECFIIASLINIGICKIELWELGEALKVFEKANSLPEPEDPEFYEYVVNFWWCLAFLYSTLNLNNQAHYFAEKTYINLSNKKKWSSWSLGYSNVFLGLTYKNLGEIEKSFEMFHKAIAFAEESHYTQVKGKALDGLAQLYREQEDFETALSNHAEAIELLDKIGAKCDLAEAYYQQGLTYQKMGEAQNSQENFDKAIQLFSEMEAPKQVEKVQQTIESER
jgi:tetratricopeptide (TPR) repeat protein